MLFPKIICVVEVPLLPLLRRMFRTGEFIPPSIFYNRANAHKLKTMATEAIKKEVDLENGPINGTENLYKPVQCKVTFLAKKSRVREDGTISTSYGYRLMSIDPKSGIDQSLVHLYGKAENGGTNIFYSPRKVGSDTGEMELGLVFAPEELDTVKTGLLSVTIAKTASELEEEKRVDDIMEKFVTLGTAAGLTRQQAKQKAVDAMFAKLAEQF
jgi:hypothetical protein